MYHRLVPRRPSLFATERPNGALGWLPHEDPVTVSSFPGSEGSLGSTTLMAAPATGSRTLGLLASRHARLISADAYGGQRALRWLALQETPTGVAIWQGGENLENVHMCLVENGHQHLNDFIPLSICCTAAITP